MFDEGTNAVTMNLPQRAENHKLEHEEQFKVPHNEPKYSNVDENLLNNFIDGEFTNFADSQKGKNQNALNQMMVIEINKIVIQLQIQMMNAISQRFEIIQSIHGMV